MSIEEQLDLMIADACLFEATMRAFGVPPCRHQHYRWLQHAVDAAKYQGGTPS